MCGICGFSGLEDKNLLKKMMDSVRHRGPDDSGFFSDRSVSLGHRRLSIIDLKTGKQPMSNEDGSIWIVFNGEIYNFQNLRNELEKRGHEFHTQSDTETIIHAYEEYGESCLEFFNGMFAFALWDSKKQRLILARDRLGIKPLYYASSGGVFLFSSEMKSILQYPGIKRDIDMQSLHDYMSFRYVPEPDTIFRSVKKLLPGHFLVCQNGRVSIKKYWDIRMEPRHDHGEYYLVKKFGELLEDSVKKMLISDVPLGMYLSGGVDSATIVALMSRLKDDPIKTFSIGYGLENFQDELKNAKMTAEHFGTDHHEFVIDFNPIEIIPKVIWHMDEPIADPTSLPVYLLSQMAKKYVTVVLVGEGADECLAGYEQYKIMKMSQKLSCLPGFLKRNAFPRLVKKTPRVILDGFFKYASSLGEEGVKRSVDFISSFGDYHEDYGKINFIFTEEEKARLYGKPHNLKKSSRIFKEYFTDRKNLLNDMLMADLKTFLLHLLTKADKMAMAHGVEGRVPYLDHRIVEFSSSIPENMKLRGKNDKYILRKFSSSLLPKAIAMRKKSRFFVPIHHWFEGDLKCEMENLFSRENVRNRGYFDHGYIENLMKKYDRSRLYYGRQLWNLMVLEIWCKTFMDKERIPSSPKNLTI